MDEAVQHALAAQARTVEAQQQQHGRDTHRAQRDAAALLHRAQQDLAARDEQVGARACVCVFINTFVTLEEFRRGPFFLLPECSKKKIAHASPFRRTLSFAQQASEERRELERQLSVVEAELSEQRRSVDAGRGELTELHAALRTAHASLATRDADAQRHAQRQADADALRERHRTAEQAALALGDELRSASAEREAWAAEHETLKVCVRPCVR